MTSLRASFAAGTSIAAILALTISAPSLAATGQDKPSSISFAVIGDVPYGAAQISAFPGWVDRINRQPGLDLAFHVGDIKNGSSPCTDEYNAMIREQFDRFEMPLLYTPGDNEWTDCHRPAAGAYHPLERLQAVRAAFYETAGVSLGARPIKVGSQADLGFPENQALRIRGVEMATLHVVGSNNDRAPWTGIGYAAPTAQQLTEESTRMAASIDLVHDTFARARQTNVLARSPCSSRPTCSTRRTSRPGTSVLSSPWSKRSSARPPPLMARSTSSTATATVYNVDQPVTAGSEWLGVYGVDGSADNLTRITVDGEANNTNFLQVTLNRPGAQDVLSWERVAYDSQP